MFSTVSSINCSHKVGYFSLLVYVRNSICTWVYYDVSVCIPIILCVCWPGLHLWENLLLVVGIMIIIILYIQRRVTTIERG